MNAITPFDFEGRAVRVVEDEAGLPWFVALDVCECLALRNSSQVIARLDEDEKGVHIVDTLGGTQQVATVNEPGLYSLTLTSRKPEAKRSAGPAPHRPVRHGRRAGHRARATAHAAGAPAPRRRATCQALDHPLVSASRSFAALARTGRTLRMSHARALAAANAATLRATGVDLIAELDAADLLMDAGPAALGHDGSGADLAKVSAWLEGRAEVTTREVIAGALDGNPDDRSLQMRTAALMRTLGWRNIQVRRGLARHRVYQRRE